MLTDNGQRGTIRALTKEGKSLSAKYGETDANRGGESPPHASQTENQRMPKQSDIFQQYMAAVWNDQILDNQGVTVYADEHDAIFIATVFRAVPTGAERGEWREWTFADGSTAWINVEGSGTTNEPPCGVQPAMNDLTINFPDMGHITLNLNALEPSIMIAIRDALIHTEDDAAEPNREINDAIEKLDNAIKSSGFENE